MVGLDTALFVVGRGDRWTFQSAHFFCSKPSGGLVGVNTIAVGVADDADVASVWKAAFVSTFDTFFSQQWKFNFVTLSPS